MSLDKTSEFESLHFIETSDDITTPLKVMSEEPFTHNDKLSQSSDESETEYSDDESVYYWSTDDDEGYDTADSKELDTNSREK